MSNKGFTLVETLLAFSIYITVVILFISLYSYSTTRYYNYLNEYTQYQIQQKEKEENLWVPQKFEDTINMVLP